MKIVLVIFSANSEWRAAKQFYSPEQLFHTPYGEYFEILLNDWRIVCLQGGWAKISAAASCQYGIQRWEPDLVINLGTCGGFEGHIGRNEIVLAERTLVYDLIEQMGDQEQAIRFYTTDLDLSWLREPYPQDVHRGLLLSADRDIVPAEVVELVEKYNGVAADWESGAIAWVAKKNGKKCLILRGVTDLVNFEQGEAYDGSLDFFHRAALDVITDLLKHLPEWIDCAF